MTDQLRHLSRRSFNALVLGAAVWPRGAAAGPSMLHQLLHKRGVERELCSLFTNLKSVHAIGAACLRSLSPRPSSPKQLADAILAASRCDADTMKTKDTIRHQIVNRMHDDFAEGAVAKVEGWLLSRTEVQLYALVALGLKEQSVIAVE